MPTVPSPPVSTPNVMQQAQEEFPVLRELDLLYKESYWRGQGYLEYWPPHEPGTTKAQRPAEFPPEKAGIEVFNPATRPLDIMGDVASHRLIHEDPVMASYYKQFEESLTVRQHGRLREQYEWARKNEGERRPFEQWYQLSGLPAYFRGYAFQQWPDAASAYEPKQRAMFDEMMGYLRKKKSPADVLYGK